eukprot:CAMPEP_0181257398 /NCGR_PEP_ID=MMETSP1096-20121128/50222_1 /TAXON_ID=156174 ORGANISM="Chrysochromulina ericina, Strain CCMP281" /NCGR_SAMPLE_ID=MMETSP1096 /ASSEMBLY_ACC=CAM_ASM_000453 /LENGTH=113 /DNA_ID=CAMNT_0023355711 /DNA_START=181 /DNA_END=522 /DNA_ORIENTATION=+
MEDTGCMAMGEMLMTTCRASVSTTPKSTTACCSTVAHMASEAIDTHIAKPKGWTMDKFLQLGPCFETVCPKRTAQGAGAGQEHAAMQFPTPQETPMDHNETVCMHITCDYVFM